MLETAGAGTVLEAGAETVLEAGGAVSIGLAGELGVGVALSVGASVGGGDATALVGALDEGAALSVDDGVGGALSGGQEPANVPIGQLGLLGAAGTPESAGWVGIRSAVGIVHVSGFFGATGSSSELKNGTAGASFGISTGGAGLPNLDRFGTAPVVCGSG